MDALKYFNRCVFTNEDKYSPYISDFKSENFDERFLDPNFIPRPLVTPFKNVRLAKPHEYVKNPILDRKPNFQGNYRDYVRALGSALEKHLLTLDDNEKYLFSHSSGMDSRFISGTMAKLRRNGKKSFSNVHFRCHAPENSLFREIMKAEGWPEDQWSTFDPNDSCYDIGRPDIDVNGWCSYSNQMNYWPDLNPKDWVILTGEGGELFKYIALHPEKPTEYCDNYCMNMLIEHNPGNGEWDNQNAKIFKDTVMPLWSYDYLEVSNAVNPEWVMCNTNTGWDNIRRDLVIALNLHGFSYVTNDYLVTWRINNFRREAMTEQFYSSRFYKKYKNKIPNDIDFFTNPFGWESKLWGFAVTVYPK